MEIRHEVLKYAHQMEHNLSKHDATRGPTGWKPEPLDYLLDRLDEEVAELRVAVESDKPYGEVFSESADVGNLAMMVADALFEQNKGRRPPAE